jgi:hypothetical protein
MDSTFDVTNQEVAGGNNTVTYTQSLSYFAVEGASQPKEYVLYPFVDTPYANELVARLINQFPDAFANLVENIGIPTIGARPVTPPPKKKFWTTPVIAGFAAGGGTLLLVGLCLGAYLLGARGRRSDGSTAGGYQDTRTHKTKYEDDEDDDNDHHDMLPTQFQMSSIGGNDDDIISTMDDPTVVNKMHSIDASAMSGGYGDQRYVHFTSASRH